MSRALKVSGNRKEEYYEARLNPIVGVYAPSGSLQVAVWIVLSSSTTPTTFIKLMPLDSQ